MRGVKRALLLLPLLVLAVIQGCASPVLQTYPAGDLEIAAVSAAFARFLETSGATCNCCLDAEIDARLVVPGLFSDHAVTFSGYLQAMKPGYLKFVAINPLGQPLIIFVTDGAYFTSLNVQEMQAYSGSAASAAYRKFAPQGFTPQNTYYWLTGRIVPDGVQLEAVMRDRGEGKYWLQIGYNDATLQSMVLFDPEELLVQRHVVRDEEGVLLMDVQYADYLEIPGPAGKPAAGGGADPADPIPTGEACRVPASITVFTNGDRAKMELRLFSFLEEVLLSADDFKVEIPVGFEQLLVK